MNSPAARGRGGKARDPGVAPFLSLDFLYIPSHDPDREIDYYTRVLGGVLLFRVKAMGTEVSAVRLTDHGPLLLLAEHLEGQLPVLIYRVDDFTKVTRRLKRRGWVPENTFEIPHGPCAIFTSEGGQRLAIYELTRPEANQRFMGRFDV